MRGSRFHCWLAAEAARTFGAAGLVVVPEHPLPLPAGGYDFVDLWVVGPRGRLICEVETTPRHVLDNVAQARSLGLPLWIVLPDRRLQRSVHLKVRRRFGATSPQRIRFLLLGQLAQALSDRFSPFSHGELRQKTGKTPPGGAAQEGTGHADQVG